MPNDDKELVQKFKEIIEDEETFLTFIRLYAPELPQKLQQANVMRAQCAEPLPPNLCCSICGYFCNNYHHYNCWFEVDGGNGA